MSFDSSRSFNKREFLHHIKNLEKTVRIKTRGDNFFSNMADWNPAEMIGAFPNPFSTSLYSKLVTERAWIESRTTLGYHAVRNKQLMLVIEGRPYIDVRKSLGSLIPKGVPISIRNKLISAQIRKLRRYPNLHDKIEFEIAVSKTSFSSKDIENTFSNDLQIKMPSYISKMWVEFNGELLKMGKQKLLNIPHIISRLQELKIFISNEKSINPKKLSDFLTKLRRIGVVPFSEMARLAFWGRSFVDWLYMKKIISDKEYRLFFSNLNTIPFFNYSIANLKGFVAKVGHLRPGSYDILSKRYSKAIKSISIYKSSAKLNVKRNKNLNRHLKYTSSAVNDFLRNVRLSSEKYPLIEMIQEFLKAREDIKFYFTTVLSEIIEGYAKWGRSIGLTRADISMLSISEMNIHQNKKTKLEKLLKQKRRVRELQSKLLLPPIIDSDTSIYNFEISEATPNFITKKRVVGEVVYLDNNSLLFTEKLRNRIVLIDAADPGYDWLFLHSIRGLVTKFGGVASHMAIRCQEYGIPAAIGCGDLIFDSLTKAKRICLDPIREIIYST